MSVYFTIDCGVNFTEKQFSNDKIAYLINVCKNYTTHFISISESIKSTSINEQIANQFPEVYYTAGIHPNNASSIVYYTELIQNLNNYKCVAVGKCGLNYKKNNHSEQIEVFEAQIQIAKQVNKPLYLVCRNAFTDFYNILKKYNYYNGVIVYFNGTVREAEMLEELGFYFGINGKTLENTSLINSIGIDKILVLSNTPWCSITNKKSSTPYDTGKIIEKIASIKSLNTIILGQIIYNNSLHFFRFNT